MHAFLDFVVKWEWLLLLSVAALETLILVKVYQERRERASLIAEMRSTRVELGRESYLAMLKEALGSATEQVLFVSHSLTANMSQRDKDSIFTLYRSGLDHRCVTGRDSGKIREMWEQQRRGVDVRVNDIVMRSTFRYQVCDGRTVVLGFAEGGDEVSRKGIRIKNTYFARVLQQHFLATWATSQPFLEYVRQILVETTSPEVPTSLTDISVEWALSPEEVSLVGSFLGRPADA